MIFQSVKCQICCRTLKNHQIVYIAQIQGNQKNLASFTTTWPLLKSKVFIVHCAFSCTVPQGIRKSLVIRKKGQNFCLICKQAGCPNMNVELQIPRCFLDTNHSFPFLLLSRPLNSRFKIRRVYAPSRRSFMEATN